MTGEAAARPFDLLELLPRPLATAFALAAPAAAPRASSPVDFFAAMPDWPAIGAAATKHRLNAVIANNLADAADVPKAIRADFARAARWQATTHLATLAHLFEIDGELRAAGIVPVWYKGPALSMQAYGAPLTRWFRDVDALVPETRFVAAAEALRRAGWRLANDPEYLAQPWFMRTTGALEFSRGGAVCDLHRSPFSPRAGVHLDPAELSRAAAPIEISGRMVSTLAPAQQFLVACFHGAWNLWQRGAWVVDVAWLLTRDAGRLNWPEVAATAHRWRISGVVRLAARLARGVCGVDIPAALGDVDRANTTHLARRVCEYWSGRADPAAGNERRLFQWHLRENRRDQLEFAARMLFTPSTYDARFVRLPPRLAPLYWAVRPVRIGVALFRRGLSGVRQKRR